eukprot:CAMPEP_0115010072 /NCGR_PEP_ID=MMETSP0216-20121206/23062_1 /TAXON_ID=223996 /ORGANISM="Protocruzia adherens, Strain Boccale" /LENGTH=84 /DNA_ID=CAMNT_0002378145 /DNA_START=27 /DNA_END=277 /DNA_ORIENTATION=-
MRNLRQLMGDFSAGLIIGGVFTFITYSWSNWSSKNKIGAGSGYQPNQSSNPNLSHSIQSPIPDGSSTHTQQHAGGDPKDESKYG